MYISPMVLEIPGLLSSPYDIDIDYPFLLSPHPRSMGRYTLGLAAQVRGSGGSGFVCRIKQITAMRIKLVNPKP